jgi:hypothetical protein
VPQTLVLEVEDRHQEVEVVLLGYPEYISADQLLDEAFPELGGDLESIYSKGQQYLDNALDVVFLAVLLEFELVVLDDCFADELAALDLALIDDDLVMLSELNLIVLDGLVQSFVPVVPLLDIVNYLQQIDGNRKYLSSGLQHLLVFLYLLPVLTLELDLILALSGRTPQHLVEFGVGLFDQF